jgi:hypothetical protein
MRCSKNKITPNSAKSANRSSAKPGSFSEEAALSHTERVISSIGELGFVSSPVSELGEVP